MPEDGGLDAYGAACLSFGNFNSFGFDYVARQKVQGNNLNWYIVEQLPVIARDAYDTSFGDKTAGDLVRDHVLRLTFTADDMFPFARDLGYTGCRSPGTLKSGDTCAPGWTRCTSTCMACLGTMRVTFSTRSPSYGGRTRRSSGITAPSG